MATKPRFPLYVDVICHSVRAENGPIAGKQVGVLDRVEGPDGGWRYKVSPDNSYSVFECLESELSLAVPAPGPGDEEILDGFIGPTAELRHSPNWEGFRSLLREYGFDPLKCFLLSCEAGDDVGATLVLPDGRVASADFREHYQTRQAIRITRWSIDDYSDREVELARSILKSPGSTAFDVQAHAYYDEKIASVDAPLPPLEWGARPWHHWEGPPRPE
jgi:hypothetical protein